MRTQIGAFACVRGCACVSHSISSSSAAAASLPQELIMRNHDSLLNMLRTGENQVCYGLMVLLRGFCFQCFIADFQEA